LSRLVPSMRHTAANVCGFWPTPTSLAQARNGNSEAGNSAGLVAIRVHALHAVGSAASGPFSPEESQHHAETAMWPTPSARDWRSENASPEFLDAWAANTKGKTLPMTIRLWATPTAVDGARGLMTRPQDTGKPLPQQLGDMLGGSPAQTEKPGALNPAFVCWLMGFPPEWESCAPTATPSSRKSQPKSSAPISTQEAAE
jgi:hypothetical protein